MMCSFNSPTDLGRELFRLQKQTAVNVEEKGQLQTGVKLADADNGRLLAKLTETQSALNQLQVWPDPSQFLM